MSNFKDNQVYLFMGVSEEADEPAIAIIGAESLDLAKAAFEKRFPGYAAMTYPSLAQIKLSVTAIENGRDGKPLPEGFGDDIAIIMGAEKPKKVIL